MVSDLANFIVTLTSRVASISWGLFMLAWSIGWLIKGAPIPFFRLKRAGQSIIEDAIWAAFWLALGTTVFALISYVASMLASSMGVNQTLVP